MSWQQHWQHQWQHQCSTSGGRPACDSTTTKGNFPICRHKERCRQQKEEAEERRREEDEISLAMLSMQQRPGLYEEQAVQRRLEYAKAQFQDANDPASMVRALNSLALARCGGAALKTVIGEWAGYAAERQQAVFDAALLAVFSGHLEEVEDQVQCALDAVP